MAHTVTKEQIDEWKAAHGEVHEIMVAVKPTTFDPHMLQDDDVEQSEHISGFIKTPSEKVLGFAMQQIARPQEAGAIILKNCWLGGDEQIKTDKAYLSAAGMQCLEFIQIRQAKLKKH